MKKVWAIAALLIVACYINAAPAEFKGKRDGGGNINVTTPCGITISGITAGNGMSVFPITVTSGHFPTTCGVLTGTAFQAGNQGINITISYPGPLPSYITLNILDGNGNHFSRGIFGSGVYSWPLITINSTPTQIYFN